MYVDEFLKGNFKLVDFMDDLVRVFDKDGFIVYTNSSMKKYLGNEEGKFCSFSDIPKQENCEKNKIYSSLKCVAPLSYRGDVVTELLSVDDKDFFVKSSPIFDENNEYWGSIEVLRDVTEENKLQKELITYKDKIKEDMTVASDVQKGLLSKLNHIEGINIEYIYISSEQLSGDFFDVIELTNNRVCFYMADVMGHGVSASMLTMFIKFSVRMLTRGRKIEHPKEILMELAKEFSKLNLEMYFTIFLGIYDKNTCEFEYSNAGHNCIPILYNKKDKNLRLELSGLPISWISWNFREKGYSVGKVKLNKGDSLIFYTDGITETKNENREDYGEERLLSVIDEYKSKLTDCEMLDKIIELNSQYRYGLQEDDIALLSIRVE